MRLRRLAVLVMVVAVASTPLAAAQGAARFAGTYSVKGTNPGGGGTYTGMLKIGARGGVYDLTWTIGNDEFRGIGVAQGNCLAVAYTDPGGSGSNVVIYRIDAAGHLAGSWATAGSDQVGSETATRK